MAAETMSLRATVMAALLATLCCAAAVGGRPALAVAGTARMRIPRAARELLVVSSPTADPAGPESIAMLSAYERSDRGSRWRLVLGPWGVETGSGHLIAAARRREGDHATPTGVFRLGLTVYGTDADPGRLHYRYHRLVCGDWWDEDPYSPRYNRFVHVPCGVTPGFAPGSEALWTETLAYSYLIPVDFNVDPVHRGAAAIGSGIFLHSWVSAATAGCVALPRSRLLRLLRWLRPSRHPMIEIGTVAELAPLRRLAPRRNGT